MYALTRTRAGKNPLYTGVKMLQQSYQKRVNTRPPPAQKRTHESIRVRVFGTYLGYSPIAMRISGLNSAIRSALVCMSLWASL